MNRTIAGGRYHLEQLVSTGLANHVWRGIEQATQRQVAIKIARERDGPSQLQREGEVLQRLRGEHLPTVIELGPDFLAMEWIPAGPLDRGAPLPPSEFQTVLGRIAAALEGVHRAGFIHGDVTLSNVLHQGPLTVLIDFNTALPIGGSTGGQFIGSSPTMAPELWRGEPVSPATDVYALAASAYMLLTGEPLFEASSTVQWMRAHLDRVPELGKSGSLAAWLAVGLAKDPAARPQRPSDLLAAWPR